MTAPQFAMRYFDGSGPRYSLAVPEEEMARSAALHAIRLGYRDVALLRRESEHHNWVEVPLRSLASRLQPVNARPFSHWKR